MKTQRCPVKECGAVVYVLPLAEGEITVDPHPLEVVVPTDDRHYRPVVGYLPHAFSCVDVSARRRVHQ